MKLSVITINFNNAGGLSSTIQSVLSQSVKPHEYLIIDGGSTDGSADLIKKHAASLAYWISEPDTGVYHAMNKGISRASGDYLLFMNSGDCFADSKTLANAIKLIDSAPGKDVYYGNMLVKHKNSAENTLWRFPAQIDLLFFKNSTINHQSSFIKKNLFEELGMYPENFRLASDYWLWLQCYINLKSFCYLDMPVALYDFGGMSAENNHQEYIEEKEVIWNQLLPQYVRNTLELTHNLAEENNRFKQLANFKIVKSALKLNKLFHKLKGRGNKVDQEVLNVI